MLHTHTQQPGEIQFPKILERIALPLLLFTAVLFTLLFISWFNILPRFTHFQISDVILSPVEMSAYAKQMKAQLSDLEETRDHLVLPVIDPAYDELKKQKRAQKRLLEIRAQLLDVAVRVPDAKDAVKISRISFDAVQGVVAFSGDVSNVGPRSMTVLAQFVEEIEKLSIVDRLERPSFTRVQDDGDSFHSPFFMTFTLRTAQQ
jgi:hypothetical protein